MVMGQSCPADMGQAKSRGAFEQRQAEGIAANIAKEQARRKTLADLEAALTPEARAKRRKLGLLLAAMATTGIR